MQPITRALRAVVFDHDGTLLDTEIAEYRAVARIWAEHGAELTVDRWSHVVGSPDDGDWWIRELEPITGRRLDDRAIIDLRRHYSHQLLAALQPRPGIRQLLADLNAAGVALAVATNAPVWWAEKRLGMTGLLAYFDVIVGIDVASAPKPNPAPFAEACAGLGVDPVDAVAIEDSMVGVASAVAAGCFTVACPCELTAGHDLSLAHARVDSHEALSFEQLAAWHSGWLAAQP